MKKDLIFTPILLLIGILLGLLKVTGLTIHIIISIVGVIGLIVYTILTKKEWKIPALEIIMRVLYGIALITGFVVMNVHGIAAINVLHKLSAALFVVGLIGLYIHKLITYFKK